MKNKALAALEEGFLAGGVEFVSNFPGFYSHDIFSSLNGERISINERVAFEIAYGASLSGKRSLVSMKNVGLNACADPFLHSMISGVNAGLVIVVTDDVDVIASQERQDSRHYFDFFGGLWFEPKSTSSAYAITSSAFDFSEEYDIPVVIRLTNTFFELNEHSSIGNRKNKQKQKQTIDRKPKKYVLYPTYWKDQHKNLILKNERIEKFVEQFHIKKSRGTTLENKKGVIMVGAHNNNLDKYSDRDICEIETYPLPKRYLTNFIKNKEDILVFEQGDDYVKKSVSTILNTSQSLESIPQKEAKEQTWVIWNHLEKLFNSIKESGSEFVVGDVGQYTVESTGVIDSCLCLGSAVGVTLGLAMSGVDYPLCVVGDTSFLHSGNQALLEAIARNQSFGIIIIDNGGSMATGGQKTISNIYDISNKIDSRTIELSKTSARDLKNILTRMKEKKALFVLYVKI